MKFEITVLYDRDSIIRGEKAYILKNNFWHIILSPFVLIMILLWHYTTNNNNIVVLITTFGTLIYFLLSMYLCFLKPFHSAKRSEKHGPMERDFIISDDGIKSESFTNELLFEWNDIKKYWFSRDTLVLISKSKRYTYIPANDFSKELKSFIVSKIEG